MTEALKVPVRPDAVSASYSTALTFESLGVAEPLCKALADQGITTAFPIQALTIADAIAGRDVCGKAKTGSGKTLAFGLPLLQRLAASLAGADGAVVPLKGHPSRPRALVLLPTRELAVQVYDVLRPLAERMGLRLVAVYGGADIERQVRQLRKGCEVIIATPGRLIDLGDRGELKVEDLDVLVLDEADRMADMGFMPQVEWVLRRVVGRPHQTLLFSATLDGAVDQLVRRYLTDPVFHEVQSDTQTVTEMVHHFFNVHQMDKVKVAAAICRANDKVLLFVRTKRGADRLVQHLGQEHVVAGAIHGDLRQSQRERALADFAAGKLHVLVATDVAARGLDIDAVDVVVHYDPPEDHKAYLHRSGRTARAGTAGVVVTLLLWNQVVEAQVTMKRIGLRLPIIEVFSNDPSLGDLAHYVPDPAASVL
ncbi:MAG TPA: DEAD/DEAH box helicase [Acidimicrobiales bacterium]|jgi:superfamily II DNA/RNA helicase|nr:DEAD/DEAH box helicase [Acidimicrobiales bacterium]